MFNSFFDRFPGGEESIAAVVKVWHRDRKSWWPSICFPNPAQVTQVDAYIDNKILACFILESKKHPFVVQLLALEGRRHNNVGSLIKQLKESKCRFDDSVAALLDSATSSAVNIGKTSQQTRSKNPSTETVPQVVATTASSPEIAAVDYLVYMSGTTPIQKNHEPYKTIAPRENNLNLYQLELEERLSKRFNTKRPERNSTRPSAESSSDSDDALVDTIVKHRSKYRPSIGEKAKKRILMKHKRISNSAAPLSQFIATSESSSQDEDYHAKIAYSPGNEVERRFRHSCPPSEKPELPSTSIRQGNFEITLMK